MVPASGAWVFNRCTVRSSWFERESIGYASRLHTAWESMGEGLRPNFMLDATARLLPAQLGLDLNK